MSISTTILVVDDEPAIRRLLRTALERGGHAVVDAATAREALTSAHTVKPDAVLLDLGLPDRDGLELVPLIKKMGAALLVVSAREDTDQKVAALDLGADDYITKPFDTEEILARIRTSLRHRLSADAIAPSLRIGELEIDLAARRVTRAGEEIHLAPKEYAVLAELAKHPGRVVTHNQLLRTVWGPAHEHDVEYLRVAARGVRKKLELDPGSPKLIRNEPGIGYRLVAEPANF